MKQRREEGRWTRRARCALLDRHFFSTVRWGQGRLGTDSPGIGNFERGPKDEPRLLGPVAETSGRRSSRRTAGRPAAVKTSHCFIAAISACSRLDGAASLAPLHPASHRPSPIVLCPSPVSWIQSTPPCCAYDCAQCPSFGAMQTKRWSLEHGDRRWQVGHDSTAHLSAAWLHGRLHSFIAAEVQPRGRRIWTAKWRD